MVVLGTILLIILILIICMDYNDKKSTNKIINSIYKHTDINGIKYINRYDDYYIVLDNKKLYLINRDYDIIIEKEVSSLYDNKNNYDIIYKDEELMYFNDYIKDNKLVYEYYNIYNYKLIDRVFVGGNYDG